MFALRWRAFDNHNTPLPITIPYIAGKFAPSARPREASQKFILPEGLADELRKWRLECKNPSPGVLRLSQVGLGCMYPANFRFRVLNSLAEELGIEKLNFQILRRTMATLAQNMGSVKDIQAHLRHARPDTTAHEYMQELPESVHEMVGSMYAMLKK